MFGSLRHRNITRDMSLLALSEDDETPDPFHGFILVQSSSNRMISEGSPWTASNIIFFKLHWKLQKKRRRKPKQQTNTLRQ